MTNPKVTVILTSFNHEKYLRQSIDSVLSQTFTDFELIIWDDASVDNSWEIINSYSDKRIKKFQNKETKRGVYGINKAISEVALGDYIAIHHSDDVWERNKLEKQVKYLDNHSNVGAVFTRVNIIDEDGKPMDDSADNFWHKLFDKQNRSRYEWLNHFFYNCNCLCHPSVLIRKVCYQECGLYKYGLAQSADFEMWTRLCFKYEIYILKEKLVGFRVRSDNANTSAPRLESRVREKVERYYQLENYLSLTDRYIVTSIFPDCKEYIKHSDFDIRFLIAMELLRVIHLAASGKILAFEVLFGLLNDEHARLRLAELHGFDIHSFVSLTGSHDIFDSFGYRGATTELYYDTGKGFNNKDVVIQDIQLSKEKYLFDLSEIQNEIEQIRLDPVDIPSKIKLLSTHIILTDDSIFSLIPDSHNGVYLDGFYDFNFNDGQIIYKIPKEIRSKIKLVEFNINIQVYDKNLIYSTIESLKSKLLINESELSSNTEVIKESIIQRNAQQTHIDNQQNQIDAQQVHIDNQQNQIDAQQVHIDNQQNQIDVQQVHIDNQQNQIDVQQVHIDNQQNQLNAQQVHIDNQQNQIDAQQAHIDDQQNQIVSSNKEINLLIEKSDEQEKMIIDLNLSIKSKNRLLAVQTEKALINIRNKQQVIKNLEDEIYFHKNLLAENEIINSNAQQQISSLTNETNYLRTEIDNIKFSATWKIANTFARIAKRMPFFIKKPLRFFLRKVYSIMRLAKRLITRNI